MRTASFRIGRLVVALAIVRVPRGRRRDPWWSEQDARREQLRGRGCGCDPEPTGGQW